MSRVLRLRRGSTAETSTFTGALAEVTVDTSTWSLVVHDNATAGGHRIATEAYVESNKAVTSTGNTAPSNNVTEGSMWFDSVSGRLYVNYNGAWIDANPTVENNTIGNLLIDDTTIRTTDNANLYLSPNGSGVVIANITGTLTGNLCHGSTILFGTGLLIHLMKSRSVIFLRRSSIFFAATTRLSLLLT